MGVEVGGLFGLLILIADVWAIVKTTGSAASTGAKAAWIVVILLLPVFGLVLWLVARAQGPVTQGPGETPLGWRRVQHPISRHELTSSTPQLNIVLFAAERPVGFGVDSPPFRFMWHRKRPAMAFGSTLVYASVQAIEARNWANGLGSNLKLLDEFRRALFHSS